MHTTVATEHLEEVVDRLADSVEGSSRRIC
jgi:hypothetical protein